MKHVLRTPTTTDAAAVSALVQRSFNELVAPDWEPEGRRVFLTESSPERFATLIPSAAFAAVAETERELIGFILLPSPSLLGFLFVAPSCLRRGVARHLWEAARAHIQAQFPSVTTIELNSSPYAVAAYRALGFYPISEPFRRGGCLATRMACWLPGRSLAMSSHAT